MTFLTLIRHGQSIYNLQNRFTGSLDVELTALGEQEALLAGQKLKNFKYDFAFTSMLRRAQESLRIILKEIDQEDMPVVKDAALDERMYGNLQGLNKDETIEKFGETLVELWRRSFAVRPPEGESLEDTFNRAVPYFKSMIEPKLAANENILIVAHGNSLRALMMYLEKIDADAIARINIPTGTPRHYVLDENLEVASVVYL